MAKVMATVPIDGDAREFLFTHVANLPKEKLNPLRRPVHLFGIRLGMPAFQVETPPKGKKKKGQIIESAEWGVDVKAESLAVDTRKLFLEATGQWPPGAEEMEWCRDN